MTEQSDSTTSAEMRRSPDSAEQREPVPPWKTKALERPQEPMAPVLLQRAAG